jgi:hypothetical protein
LEKWKSPLLVSLDEGIHFSKEAFTPSELNSRMERPKLTFTKLVRQKREKVD